MSTNRIRNLLAMTACGAALAAAGLTTPVAQAYPQDDVLCSSNMAFRTTHKDVCKDIAINSHGGGGGMSYGDSDGDGVNNDKDADPRDPGVQ